MYRITKVALHDFCQYEDATFDIDSGLNAVVGRNAGGKTNLLRGIAYALTGKVDGAWGTQQKLQRDGSVSPGYASVWFTDGKTDYKITRFSTVGRNFRDLLTTVNADGGLDQVAVGRQQVDAAMADILGISVDLMFQICWGRQGELAYFLTAPAAIVNQLLVTVFDSKRLEKLRDVLKTQIDTVAQLSEQCKTRLQEASDGLKALPDVSELPAYQSRLEARFRADKEHYENLLKSVAGSVTAQQQQTALASLTARLATVEQQLKAAEDQPTYELPELPEEDARKQHDALAQQLKACEKRIRDNNAEFIKRSAERDQLVTTLDRLKSRYAEVTKDVEVHRQDAECVLCGGHVSDTAAYIKRYAAIHMSNAEAEMQTLSDRIESLGLSITYAESEVADAEKDKQRVANELTAVDEVLLVYEALRDAAKRYELTQSLKAMQTQLLADIEKQKAVPVISAEVLAQLSEARNQYEATQSDLDGCKGAIAETEARRKYLQRALADAKAQAAQFEINKEARELLIELRDSYSQRRAQARYMRGKIEELNAEIAEFMADAQMPFVLRLNPDTHVFEYTSNDGFVHPTAHLSGAQQTIASVILQMGILRVVNPNMNLFMTDEPSESLDDENKFIQASLFASLSTLMPSIDGVMLIVTRDHQLIEACNNVIDILKERE